MSGEIRLDLRLAAIASFVTDGSVVADIGCDHGYLLCSLLQKGRITRGFACDINPGPLEQAKKNIKQNRLSGKIDALLTDGLTDLPYEIIDTFIIAGMGGDLISEILLRYGWTRDRRFNFILQPMTKPERLRQALCENGFSIMREQAVVSAGKIYSIMEIKFTNCINQPELYKHYSGLLLENIDSASRLYLEDVIYKLEKKAEGISVSKKPGDAEKYLSIATEIKREMNANGA